MTQVDHYTPLSRAVASIDRDAYAARFAIYDRAHKALLRRLATGEIPCSDADVEREEHAFREAVRRIEFADEFAAEERAAQQHATQERATQERAAQERAAQERATQERAAQERVAQQRAAQERAAQERAAQQQAAQERTKQRAAEEPEDEELAEAEAAPPLVPQRGPPEDALQELRRDAPWPEVRIPRESVRDSFEDVDHVVAPSLEPSFSDPSIGPLARLRRPSRSVMRRVGERLALAVVVLIFGAAWVIMADSRRSAAEQSAPPAVETATDAAATDAARVDSAEIKPQQPGWLSPELFYTVPPPPSARPAPPPASAHRP